MIENFDSRWYVRQTDRTLMVRSSFGFDGLVYLSGLYYSFSFYGPVGGRGGLGRQGTGRW